VNIVGSFSTVMCQCVIKRAAVGCGKCKHISKCVIKHAVNLKNVFPLTVVTFASHLVFPACTRVLMYSLQFNL